MKVCLIGATHPCHNPRLVREADSLIEAGADVRVVAPSFVPMLEPKDARLMSRRQWRFQAVDFQPRGLGGRARFQAFRVRSWGARELFVRTGWKGVAETAYQLAAPELARAAASEFADWFVAHAHGALPAAVRSARRWRAKAGFDCEDLLSESPGEPREIIRSLESSWIRSCDYVSVPSDAIGDTLAESYGLCPLTLYNVFPSALARVLTPPRQRSGAPRLRLHWFGQVVGEGRGLEEAAQAAAILGDQAELHLRGLVSEVMKKRLRALAGGRVLIRFHPLVDHDELIASLGDFDVGLVLERPANTCYARTVTNKLFSYLLAGLAVAATDTPGQREIFQKAPGVGLLYQAGDAGRLAEILRVWALDRERLRMAQTDAWNAARERFNWDVEKLKLLRVLELQRLVANQDAAS